ncbi:MAG: sensor domain-containing diguanylate cyclase [Chloroflexota bacterium]
MAKSFLKRFRKLKPALLYGLVTFGLYLTGLYNYLLFHSLVEIFSVLIGWCIFILAWNSQKRLDNHYLLFLGIAYLFVSALDLLHMLAYKGMGVFTSYDGNLPTQLWVAARYLQSISLLMAPLFLHRNLNARFTMWAYAAVTGLLLLTIFTGIFPACFVVGEGLTLFKVVSEYIVVLLLLIAILFLLEHRRSFDGEMFRWLIAALLLMISTELAFTSYHRVDGFPNLAGHLFKIFAFYFVYKSIVEMGLEKPHRLLFRDLKQSELALRIALREVRRMATVDSLTGLHNRRNFFDLAEHEFRSAQRYQHSLSAIMLDIDRFKAINDGYGHLVGDRVLQAVAECCCQTIRNVDILGRYGGEEFAVILPKTDHPAACQVAERLRQRIEQAIVKTDAGPVTVTVSLGVSAMRNEHLTLEALLADADQALYLAKRNGRNTVAAYPLAVGQLPEAEVNAGLC